MCLMAIYAAGCQGDSLAPTDAQDLQRALESLQETEKTVLRAHKIVREDLKALSLKDSARLDVLERDMVCKKTLEKIGFTRRQYKRRLKALKSGRVIPALEPLPDFTCD